MIASFTVTVSTAAHGGVTFDIATADGTGPSAATAADGDYVARALAARCRPARADELLVRRHGQRRHHRRAGRDIRRAPHRCQRRRSSSTARAVGTIVNDDEPPPVATDVVISQVYGGGGNAGATLTHDFIELFNRGTTTVNLGGLVGAVHVGGRHGHVAGDAARRQHSRPAATTSFKRPPGPVGSIALPTPDATGTIAMAAGAGKVALQVTTRADRRRLSRRPAPRISSATAAANCFEGIGPRRTRRATRLLRSASAAAASTPTTTTSTSRSATRCRATPRSPTRSCIPVPAAIHDIQGSGLDVAVRRPGRDHDRHRHRHQDERLLPAGAGRRRRRRSRHVGGPLRVHGGDAGGRGRRRGGRSRHGERVLRPDADRELAAGRRHGRRRPARASRSGDADDRRSSIPPARPISSNASRACGCTPRR